MNSASGSRHPRLAVGATFVGSAALYVFTAAPSIGLGDTALLFDAIRRLKLDSHVNTHNLSVLVGALFQALPFEDPFYRATLGFAFVGAATVAVFFYALRRATGNAAVAGITSAILAVSHSQWWHSSMLESYAVNGLLTAITLSIAVALRERYRDGLLLGLFFVAGLAIFNHVAMGIISIAATVILVDRVVRQLRSGEVRPALRLFGLASLCFALGFLPYAATFTRDALHSGNLAATFHEAVFGKFQSTMLSGGVAWAIRDVSFLIAMQFPGPFLLAILWGLAEAPRQLRPSAIGLALAAMFGANLAFFSTFAAWDRFAHMLPFWIFLAFVGGLGLSSLWPQIRSHPALRGLGWACAALSVATPLLLYPRLAEWGREPGFFYDRFNNQATENTHDTAEYIANPNKRSYRDVIDFVDAAFLTLPPSATLVDTDSRTYYVLRLFQTDREPRRPDLEILLINSWGFDDWGLTPLQLAQRLGEAHRYDGDLLLTSLGPPFDGYLRAAGTHYRFDRFPLDAERWLYRLRTAADEGSEPFFPARSRLDVGLAFDRGEGQTASTFGTEDEIMVRMHFEPNASPFPLVFEWQAPDGEIAFASRPFVVPAGHKRIWSKLAGKRIRTSGSWRVRARCDDRTLAEASFEIR